MKTKIFSALAAGSLLLGTLAAPVAFADTNTQIAGNGAFSTSNVTTNSSSNQNVTQNNSATVTNTVTSNTNTGDNTADFNTGGSTGIQTGDASSNVSIDTKANVNQASIGCNSCSTNGNNSVAVVGNGYGSNNNVDTNSNNNTSVSQNNNAYITNSVSNNANTGNNDASGNTGGWNNGGSGNVQINTGSANSTTDISNAANANEASVGGASGANNGSSDVSVVGNGAFSNNRVNASDDTSARVSQNNSAYVTNNVRSNNTTGNNTADYNTNADVHISTGGASDNTRIRNLLNFNAADLGCGCVTTGTHNIDVAGNGYGSFNTVNANTNNNSNAFQNNYATLSNFVTPEFNSGNNRANGNTGWFGGANNVFTGSGLSTTDINNATGANVFGQGVSVPFPGGFNLNFGFDLGSLLNGMF